MSAEQVDFAIPDWLVMLVGRLVIQNEALARQAEADALPSEKDG